MNCHSGPYIIPSAFLPQGRAMGRYMMQFPCQPFLSMCPLPWAGEGCDFLEAWELPICQGLLVSRAPGLMGNVAQMHFSD